MFTSADARRKYLKPSKTSVSNAEDLIEGSTKKELTTVPVTTPRSLATRRLRNLTSILQLSLLRRDTDRALRAFSLLLRCERHGVRLATLWELGLEVLLRSHGIESGKAEEFLGRARLASSDIGHHPTTEKQLVALFSSLLVVMIRKGQYKEALSEVNNELLNWPYSESPRLRHYAQMLLRQHDALQGLILDAKFFLERCGRIKAQSERMLAEWRWNFISLIYPWSVVEAAS